MEKLKTYANENGIRIIGDIPIYVAYDSADTWAHPELFQLDEENVPLAVAGCLRTGLPLTDSYGEIRFIGWDYHRRTGYTWWMQRLSYAFYLYDVVRIDHFRGFDEYFSIPYWRYHCKKRSLGKKVPELNIPPYERSSR